MDRLSSCYFCGAALDAQLSEYPVVPRRLQSEGAGSKTVVLCDGCRRKLGNVLEDVVAAAEDESRDAPDYEGTGFEPIGTATNGEAPAERSAAEELTDDSDQRDEDSEARSTAETADEYDSPSDDEPTQSPEKSGTTVDADTGGASGEDDSADDDSDGPSLTKLEYNKVMRLLQNREFPVDRLEIREVATSAYQIDPEEFDRVIEAAIERGLIAEEDGQFVEAGSR